MNKHLAIGGPLHGWLITSKEARADGYEAYNCASRHGRTKRDRKRAEQRGEYIPPSMVWVHEYQLRSISG